MVMWRLENAVQAAALQIQSEKIGLNDHQHTLLKARRQLTTTDYARLVNEKEAIVSESKFAKQFERLAATSPRPYKLRGATLLVEVFPKEELKTSGGIILGKANNQRANAEEFRRSIGLVLLQGDGYSDGSEMEIKVGMVVMVPYNPLYLSEFPGLQDYTQNSLALVNEGDVLFAYNSLEDYKRAREVLSDNK